MNTAQRSILKQFGRRVATKRKGKGLTQKQLATRANISAIYVSSIEAGRRWPRLKIQHALANALGIKIAELFKGITFEPSRKINS